VLKNHDARLFVVERAASKIVLVDATGKVIPTSGSPADIENPDHYWIALPHDSPPTFGIISAGIPWRRAKDRLRIVPASSFAAIEPPPLSPECSRWR